MKDKEEGNPLPGHLTVNSIIKEATGKRKKSVKVQGSSPLNKYYTRYKEFMKMPQYNPDMPAIGSAGPYTSFEQI